MQERAMNSSYLQDKANYRNNKTTRSVDRYQTSSRLDSPLHYSTPVKEVYSVPQKEMSRNNRNLDTYRQSSTNNAGINTFEQNKSIYAVPHKIIYDTASVGAPFTKFRTRIVINSES